MSRDTKRQLVWYQVDDTEAAARHMEKMAAKGWLLESVDNWWHTYRRAGPVRVKYAVAFFPEASVFDPALTEGQETYADYCRAAGWELAAAYGPVQYFRSTRPDPVPIETDETVKLAAVRRTMRKTFVPTYALLLLFPAMSLPVQLRRFAQGPMSFLSSAINLSYLLLMAGILLFSGGFLLDYLVWILRSRRSVARGGPCAKPHTRARLWGSAVMLAVCAAVLLWYFMDLAGMRVVLGVYLAVYGGTTLLGRWGLRRLKRGGSSRGRTRKLFFAFAAAAGLAVGFGTVFLFMRLADAGVIRMGREPAETYTYVTRDGSFRATRDVYHDELPVTLEDLGYAVAEEDHCTYKAKISRSPLALYGEYEQDALNFDSGLPYLFYQTCEIRWPWLLEKCWKELTRYEEDGPWPLRELAPAPWGAVEGYKRGDLTSYLLLYPDRVVAFRMGDDAAPEQLEAVALALAG